MRSLIFGAILFAVASVGFHALISSSLAAARDAEATTFSERFASSAQACSGQMRKAAGSTPAGRHFATASVGTIKVK